jgi:hypothetical protein
MSPFLPALTLLVGEKNGVDKLNDAVAVINDRIKLAMSRFSSFTPLPDTLLPALSSWGML